MPVSVPTADQVLELADEMGLDLTDADVDGMHIRLLLITLSLMQCQTISPRLSTQGRLAINLGERKINITPGM